MTNHTNKNITNHEIIRNTWKKQHDTSEEHLKETRETCFLNIKDINKQENHQTTLQKTRQTQTNQ